MIRGRALPGPQPWIIAMTAEALSGDEARCHAAGMDDYVAKPVQLPALAAAIQRGLRARSAGAPDPGGAPPAAPDELEERLAALATDLGADFVDIMILDFLDEAPRHRASLVDARRRDDAADLKRCAHTLQGEASNLGVRALVAACLAVQRAADGELAAPTAALLEALAAGERLLASRRARADPDAAPQPTIESTPGA